MKKSLKRLLSLILVAALFVNTVPVQVFAVEETEVYLPEMEIGRDILDHDVFYLATASAQVQEDGHNVYLLRVGRGGPADSESAVLIKIADLTAKYGKDYIVRVKGEGTKVDNPEDNFSLMEMMEDSDFEQRAISDSDEFAEQIESDTEAQEAYREGVNAALEFLEDASGLSEKYGDDNPYADALDDASDDTEDAELAVGEDGEDAGLAVGGDAEDAELAVGEDGEDAGLAVGEDAEDAELAVGEDAKPATGADAEDVESSTGEDTEDAEPATGRDTEDTSALQVQLEAVPNTDEGAIPAVDDGETITIGSAGKGNENVDPVQAAANLFTGQNATAQRLTTDGDAFQDLQSIANVMTNAVVGASVELTFAEGEAEKYLEIVPKDNREGSGDRMFYIILGTPSGTTTNSAASTCAFTILDDEEPEPAVVSFSDAVYNADGESVIVTVERSGAMNTVVSAAVKTTGEGTAKAGRDYSEVDAELVFPFGVDHLTVDIPVRTEYLTGEGSFGLTLEPTAGCETGENAAATVYLDGSYTGKASLTVAQNAEQSEALENTVMAASSTTTTDRNNLSTYKTLGSIDLSKPFKSYTNGMQSINRYLTDKGRLEMMYAHKDSAGEYGGKVESFFELTDDYWTSYFLSGAQVHWYRTPGGNDHALMRVALVGGREAPYQKYPFASGWAASLMDLHFYDAQVSGEEDDGNPVGITNLWISSHHVWWFPYSSDRSFTIETRYIYPSLAAIDPSKQARYSTPEGNSIYVLRDKYNSQWEKYISTQKKVSFISKRDMTDYEWFVEHRRIDSMDQILLWYGFKPITLDKPKEDYSDSEWRELAYSQLTPLKPELPQLIDLGGPVLGGDHPQAIGFLNWGKCKDCNCLYIDYVAPILRPFQINVRDGDHLTFLLEDGSRGTISSDTSVSATIAEAGKQAVLFMNDSFTVNSISGSNVNQYSYIHGLDLLDGKDDSKVLYTLATNNNPANTSITYTMSTENMEKMIKTICPEYGRGETQNWFNLLRENTQVNAGQNKDGYATYALYNIKPTFDYLDASVTLRNPYNFPVTMVISGTEYKLNAKEVRTINTPDDQPWHRGDTMAVSKITLDEDVLKSYTPVGIKYWGKFRTTDVKLDEGTKLFVDDNVVCVSSGSDRRLNYAEVIVEPKLQAKDNKIEVWVKNSELSMFLSEDEVKTVQTVKLDENGNPVLDENGEQVVIREVETLGVAGVLGTKGRVEGDNTVFTYAGTDRTVNGKLYAITATPRSDSMVCVWEDNNTMRTYEGNTFYFTAGEELARNQITLSAAPATLEVTLRGTLKYTSYNLRAGLAGIESNIPAAGAIIAAGSAGGVADKNGLVSAGPIPCSGVTDRYLRYLVSVNGADLVQETPLPSVNPTILWDFNFDNAMSAHMGVKSNHQVSFQADKDSDGNEYYTFTAEGADPYISIDNASVTNADELRYVKIRARNLSGAEKMELFGAVNGRARANTNVKIDLYPDMGWHEYIANIQEINTRLNGRNYWTGSFDWLRLDPMYGDIGAGSKIQIDYVAFFPDEEQAKAYRGNGSAGSELLSSEIDISSNFPSGVSPVTSSIFKDIQIEGAMNDSAYQIDGGTIPVVEGKTANMTIRVRPQKYAFSMTGKEGSSLEVLEDDLTENPISMQLVVYDKNDVFRGEYEMVDTFKFHGGYFVFSSPMEFVKPEELMVLLDEDNEPVLDDNGKPVYVKMGEDGKPLLDKNGQPIPAEVTYGLIPEPGDKLYLRLVTDRLAQVDELRTRDDQVINEYRYSDVFTGLTFRQPVSYAAQPKMGLKEPIEIEYGNLPFVGDTGMDLAFPFVNVGIMKIYQGYRVYIGVSPVQIADSVKETHMSEMSGAGGQYWKDLFSIKHPFDTFFGGMKEVSTQIGEIREAAKAAKTNKESYSTSSLGSPSWKFDISVGMYFDFTYCTVRQGQSVETYYKFDGLGGYVSVSLGFSMAWYIILPVVFMPAYLGIEIGGTVMGFLGADFNTKAEISYDESMNGSVDINDGISSLTGAIRGSAYVQISLGVGLCGTLGVRGSGKVDMIANWDPTDPNGSWGFYVELSAGFIIDLFLFSVPLMYSFPGWPFGSFDYYSKPEKWTDTAETVNAFQSALAASAPASTFRLRDGSGEDSVWLGDQAILMSTFAPNKDNQKLLVEDAYERPDSQIITLADGETVVLAFIDSDNSKGEAQRTTLKMATYANGFWSDAVTVSADDTADFQPSIAETKDGRILVAWVSTSDSSIADLSTDEQVMNYLNSMEVYSAFIELDDNKQIKTRDDNSVTVADTAVTRISNDHYTSEDGIVSSYYDANPTVVCDMESGDAMVYYIKSGRSSLNDGEITDYVNPYTNDCVVCYMPYNSEADVDTDGRTVPAGWLFENFYYAEMHGDTANEETLIRNFGGQRFLSGASYTKPDGTTERYAIPDFAAISYNGLAIYAYTVDTDGSNDTDADKELYLQVYDFLTHETKYRILLTDDDVSDTMPQFFRSKVNSEDGYSTDAENTHTKLFWYRNGKQVVYIDVTSLLRDGINTDGTLKTEADDPENEYTYVLDGKTYYRYTDPRSVWFVSDTDSHASLSQPDFRAVEDSKGNLYVLWTECVTDEDGDTAQEIFGTGLVGYETTNTNEDGSTETTYVSSGWSRPYQITRDGWSNDEMTVAMSGDNIMMVHNRFHEDLVEIDEDAEYNGQVDFTPLVISDLALVADVLEPCGSVEAESITLYRIAAKTVTVEDGKEVEVEDRTPVILPVGGEELAVEVNVANNGMNIAEGYKLSLYAGDTLVDEIEVSAALAPNSGASHRFDYTMPADVDGLVFKAVVQEMRDSSGIYYNDRNEYAAEPVEAKSSYTITDAETYQLEDAFHARFSITNNGNAASSSDDMLSVKLHGPANLSEMFDEDEINLYNEPVSLGIGETREFDIPVNILPEMMEEYGFVNALITVQKDVVEQTINGHDYMGTRMLSNLVYADFDLVVPMNMTLEDVTVGVNDAAEISFTMDLGDKFRDSSVTFAVDDLTIVRLDNGKVVGVNGGTTTLHATHAATGATVSSTVTVTEEHIEPADPTDPTDSTEPTDPTDSTKPTDPTDSTEPTDPTDSTKPTDSTNPAKPTDSTNPTKPVNGAKSTDSTKRTGDSSNLPLWFTLMFASAIGAAYFIVRCRRRDKREEQ